MKLFLKIVAGVVVGIGIVLMVLLTMCSMAWKATTDEQNEKLLNISISDLSDERSPSKAFYYIRGRVTNDGDEPVKFVQVGVDFLDADGAVIQTESTFAVSTTPLAPGASKPFEVMTESAHIVKICKTYSAYVILDK
jgi:hypothetical protein